MLAAHSPVAGDTRMLHRVPPREERARLRTTSQPAHRPGTKVLLVKIKMTEPSLVQMLRHLNITKL